MFEDYEFALCLTHDVDRPYKTYQGPYYALKERDPSQLTSLFGSENPYWQFEEIMQLEDELGVRSSFYFLNEKRLLREKPVRAWLRPSNWVRYTGNYRIDDPDIVDVIQRLDEGGWEVGLHGSFDSYADRERLEYEKAALERVLGDTVLGGRQHFLNLERPETWEYHRDIGLKYDASLGSSTEYGFQHGYDVLRPFDDEFVVFPLTVMEVALVEGTASMDEARAEIDSLLSEAAAESAVMSVLWHPRLFNEEEFPGFRELYRYLLTRAKEEDAWAGPCKDFIKRHEAD